MCQQEDDGVRPVHRSRFWKAKERVKEKDMKITISNLKCHKSQQKRVSASIIIDPTAGNTTKELR